jgi:hypothetical protein
MGNLEKDTGPVSGAGIRAAGPAVGQVFKDLQSFLNNGVRFPTLDVDDESDTAGIFLKRGVVQALIRGKTGNHNL